MNSHRVHLHEQATRRAILPLFGMTALAIGLLIIRVVRTGSLVHSYIAWNLLLAWMPLALAYLALRPTRAPWPWRTVLVLAWLLFLPNAPYLVTDLMHLHPAQGVPVLYDVVLLFSAALCGLTLGLLSLRWMLEAAAARLGVWTSRILGVGVLGATGFGVYLGRYQRWNSWDILLEPTALGRDVLLHVLHPVEHWQAWVLAGLFAGLLLVAYGLLAAMSGPRPEGC